ncbi:MAG: hypothetical protein [Circular genetic element sp.]|nr:MAG: hypothetical protein [Circular genetic element sp.]
MAEAMTNSFYLTETVVLPAATASGVSTQATIDLSAYINVPTGQCVAVSSVDFVYQRVPTFGQDVDSMVAGNGAISVQLTDLNQGTNLVRADNQSLVASGALVIDQVNNIASNETDLYPDNFGPSKLSSQFLIVNDSLYLTAMPAGTAIGASDVAVTARIRASVVKLSQRDWMAIAIQSSAEA